MIDGVTALSTETSAPELAPGVSFKRGLAEAELALKLIAGWPKHAKASDAMLNIASSQDAMGDAKAAQKTLETLIQTYPDTPAAASAKQRLSQVKRR